MDEKENQDKKPEIKIDVHDLAGDGSFRSPENIQENIQDSFDCVVDRWNYRFFTIDNTDLSNQTADKETPVLYILIGKSKEEKLVLYCGQTADIIKRSFEHNGETIPYEKTICFTSTESGLTTNDMVFLERGAVAMINTIAARSTGTIEATNKITPSAASHYHDVSQSINAIQMLNAVGVMYGLLSTQIILPPEYWDGLAVLKAIIVNPKGTEKEKQEQNTTAEKIYKSSMSLIPIFKTGWLIKLDSHKQQRDVSNKSSKWLYITIATEAIIILILGYLLFI